MLPAQFFLWVGNKKWMRALKSQWEINVWKRILWNERKKNGFEEVEEKWSVPETKYSNNTCMKEETATRIKYKVNKQKKR